jgi:hypothetical protein
MIGFGIGINDEEWEPKKTITHCPDCGELFERHSCASIITHYGTWAKLHAASAMAGVPMNRVIGVAIEELVEDMLEANADVYKEKTDQSAASRL